MTLRQLLLTGKTNDIKGFFRNQPPSVFLLLMIVTFYVQSFPEEMRTKAAFLGELESMKEDADFSDYSESSQGSLKTLSESASWDDTLEKAMEVISTC